MSFGEAPGWRSPRVLAWLITGIMAATVCVSVLRIPLQVTDSLIPMLDAQRIPSVFAAFAGGSTDAGYFRPLRAAQIQALFELAHGHYFLAFKGFQAAMVVVVFALFVAQLQVRSRERLGALLFALTVLVGLHTFRGTVWEAYPVNHSLEVVAFCLAALLLSQSRGGAWIDAAAALTLIAAACTVESGLLVWVVLIVAWMTGARGVSRRGLVIATVLVGGYLALRFGYLRTGVPALSERSSGFGLRQLSPGELQQRFGAWPYGFYAYNVLTSIATVLFSEPRAGIWTIPAEMARGRIAGGTIINVVSSAVTTSVIAWYASTRASLWRRGRFERDDRVVVVAFAVIVANAVISYGYTKDEIMGPGGVFYALAAFVAIASLIASAGTFRLKPAQATALVFALAVTASGWVVRTAGLHYQMHLMTFYDRNEWVYVDDWLERQRSAPTTDAGRALVQQLRRDAIEGAALNPYLLSPRLDQWFR